MHTLVEIMDTTLRDGEQTVGVAFSPAEKLAIAQVLLEEVGVDRIEVASARVSAGELQAVQRITQWAQRTNNAHKIEVLGFLDGSKSIDWILQAGGTVINLLCKGSIAHLQQLKLTPGEHIAKITNTVQSAERQNLTVNVYLEDWSNGMQQDEAYIHELVTHLRTLPIKRIMLPDTLGILLPMQTQQFVTNMRSAFPHIHFDFHAHNDYDCATANTAAAIMSGIHGVHTTVNGLGERTGNASLAGITALCKDHIPTVRTNIQEQALSKISTLVAAFSGINVPTNSPIVGEHVFTQTCGVHADGDAKANLYCNKLIPERFGRNREYALGKTAGRASVQKNLDKLGIDLTKEELQLVTNRIVQLGDSKQEITKEDLPFIIADVLGTATTQQVVEIENYFCSHVYKLKPVATLRIRIHGQSYEATATGDGQYDAFMNALATIYEPLKRTLPQLSNYKVSIPPGGKTDALVKTSITWNQNGTEFKTMGLESDQQAAAIAATIKMLNLIENTHITLR